MSIALDRRPRTRAQFLDWVGRQEMRHEFDGVEPVPMQGASINHNQVVLNLSRALYSRLKGSGCRILGPDAGLATIGERVRYPDVLVSRERLDGAGLLVPGVVAVFEVISISSVRTDRVIKVREYLAVPSIQTYAIIEQDFPALTLLERREDGWMATTLTAADTLVLPALGVAIPMAELYEETDLLGPEPAPA